jgi:hypothetical protein
VYRRQIEAIFFDALPENGPAGEIVFDSMQLTASWNAWAFLRYDCNHSSERAKMVMTYGLEAVLAWKG